MVMILIHQARATLNNTRGDTINGTSIGRGGSKLVILWQMWLLLGNQSFLVYIDSTKGWLALENRQLHYMLFWRNRVKANSYMYLILHTQGDNSSGSGQYHIWSLQVVKFWKTIGDEVYKIVD